MNITHEVIRTIFPCGFRFELTGTDAEVARDFFHNLGYQMCGIGRLYSFNNTIINFYYKSKYKYPCVCSTGGELKQGMYLFTNWESFQRYIGINNFQAIKLFMED